MLVLVGALIVLGAGLGPWRLGGLRAAFTVSHWVAMQRCDNWACWRIDTSADSIRRRLIHSSAWDGLAPEILEVGAHAGAEGTLVRDA